MSISEFTEAVFATLKWTADGLVPAIVQDAETNDVLMMAWMDRTALRQTLLTGETHFYSRSRQSAWHKGETSGHVQRVAAIFVDCDADVLLIKARQVGRGVSRRVSLLLLPPDRSGRPAANHCRAGI